MYDWFQLCRPAFRPYLCHVWPRVVTCGSKLSDRTLGHCVKPDPAADPNRNPDAARTARAPHYRVGKRFTPSRQAHGNGP